MTGPASAPDPAGPARWDEDRVPRHNPAEPVHFWVIGVLHSVGAEQIEATRAGGEVVLDSGSIVRVTGIHCARCGGNPDDHEAAPCSGAWGGDR